MQALFDSYSKLSTPTRREMYAQLTDPLKQILFSCLPLISPTAPKYSYNDQQKKNSVKALAFCQRNHRKTPIVKSDANSLMLEEIANELGQQYSSGVGRLYSLDVKPTKPGTGRSGGGRTGGGGSELASKLSLFG